MPVFEEVNYNLDKWCVDLHKGITRTFITYIAQILLYNNNYLFPKIKFKIYAYERWGP